MVRKVAYDITQVIVRRPTSAHCRGILKVLKSANFDAIGGTEMPNFPLCDCFVAIADGSVIGVAGYRLLGDACAKTTLLAVDPVWRNRGIGDRLQRARLEVMKDSGARVIYTNTDDERVVDWLVTKYGFRRTGKKIPKAHTFGDPQKDHWVNLVLEMEPRH